MKKVPTTNNPTTNKYIQLLNMVKKEQDKNVLIYKMKFIHYKNYKIFSLKYFINT